MGAITDEKILISKSYAYMQKYNAENDVKCDDKRHENCDGIHQNMHFSNLVSILESDSDKRDFYLPLLDEQLEKKKSYYKRTDQSGLFCLHQKLIRSCLDFEDGKVIYKECLDRVQREKDSQLRINILAYHYGCMWDTSIGDKPHTPENRDNARELLQLYNETYDLCQDKSQKECLSKFYFSIFRMMKGYKEFGLLSRAVTQHRPEMQDLLLQIGTIPKYVHERNKLEKERDALGEKEYYKWMLSTPTAFDVNNTIWIFADIIAKEHDASHLMEMAIDKEFTKKVMTLSRNGMSLLMGPLVNDYFGYQNIRHVIIQQDAPVQFINDMYQNLDGLLHNKMKVIKGKVQPKTEEEIMLEKQEAEQTHGKMLTFITDLAEGKNPQNPFEIE